MMVCQQTREGPGEGEECVEHPMGTAEVEVRPGPSEGSTVELWRGRKER